MLTVHHLQTSRSHRVLWLLEKQPMPFFARPIACKLCANVQERLVDPNLVAATSFIE